MKTILVSAFLCFSALAGQAQTKIDVKDSPKYQVSILFENCKTQDCKGKGTITFTDKKSKKVIQTLAVNELASRTISGQKEPLHQVVLSEDYNFDGENDLLIRNKESVFEGNRVFGSGNYYIFDKAKQQFVLNEELSKLSEPLQNDWTINKDKKRLEYVYEKSVTGYENVRGYELDSKGKLVLVYEASQTADDKDLITTIRELKNGKWLESVSREKF